MRDIRIVNQASRSQRRWKLTDIIVGIVVSMFVACVTSRVCAQSYSIADEAPFTSDRGHGFDLNTQPDGDKPWFFSVKLPEGNYNVTLVLGDANEPSLTTVKAESRRLMLENV